MSWFIQNVGDQPKPTGAAAEAIVHPYWPQVSESAIDAVAQEQQGHADWFNYHGEATRQDARAQAELLQGAAGEAHYRLLGSMAAHAFDASDHFASKVRTANSLSDVVRGVKTQLSNIADAAQPEWDAAVKSGVPGAVSAVVAKYQPEVLSVVNAGLDDIALTPPPTPPPLDPNTQHNANQPNKPPTDERMRAADPSKKSDRAKGESDTTDPAAHGATDTPAVAATPGSGLGPQPPNAYLTRPTDQPAIAPVPPGIPAGPGRPADPAGPGVPSNPGYPSMPSVPFSPLGAGGGGRGFGGGLGSGAGGVSPGSLTGGLSSVARPAASLRSAGTLPASAPPPPAVQAFSAPLAHPSSSFGSGLASGMGASGAMPPPPVEAPAQPLRPFLAEQPAAVAPMAGVGGYAAGGPDVGPSAAGMSGPVFGADHAAPQGVPAGGSSSIMAAPPIGGGAVPLAPYSPSGAGAFGAPDAAGPVGPTSPSGAAGTSSGAAGSPAGSAGAASPGAAPFFAGGSGAGVSSALASLDQMNPDLVAAQAVLAGLVRGSHLCPEFEVVSWAVSVLRTPVGAQTYVASSVGGGSYIPVGVFLPLTARMATFDPALPIGWAAQWMGWQSPSAILEDHFERLSEAVGGLSVSAIVTSEWCPGRPDCGGDFLGVAPREILLAPGEAPVLDGAHQHRLTAADPALAARVRALDRGGNVTAWAGAQLTAAVIQAGLQPDASGEPLATQRDAEILDAVNHGTATEERWQKYLGDVRTRGCGAVNFPELHAPRDVDSSESSRRSRMFYSHFYRMGRVVELVKCWQTIPVSLADIAYCGVAAGYGPVIGATVTAMEQYLEQQLRQQKQQA